VQPCLTIPSPAPKRRSLWRAPVWTLALAATRCVIPAPVDPVSPPIAPLLVIQTSDLSPQLETTKVMRSNTDGTEFSVKQAIRAYGTRQPLYYYWFWDLAKGPSPVARKTCGNEPVCRLFVCLLSDNNVDKHTLSLYVSDQALPVDAKQSVDGKQLVKIPAGTLSANVTWPLELSETCP